VYSSCNTGERVKIKENEGGGTCNKRGRNNKYMQNLLWKLNWRDHIKGKGGVHGRNSNPVPTKFESDTAIETAYSVYIHTHIYTHAHIHRTENRSMHYSD
jgi:hypothetical protein